MSLRLLACWITDLSPAGTWMSVVSAVCCQVEVSVIGQSLVQVRRTKCGMSESDLQTSTMRRPRPSRAVKPLKN
jgi:hypothetical protein